MVKKVVVKKILSDEQVKKLVGTKLPRGYFKKVVRENVDVYTDDGKLLLKFRRNVLPQRNVKAAYDNLIEHAQQLTTSRGIFGGPGKKSPGKKISRVLGKNPGVATNIVGYFDTIGVSQKAMLKKAGLPLPKCRETAFVEKNPKKWKKIIPLIKDISQQYKKLFPKYYALQKKQVKNNKYIIPGTVYSTVTTNYNVHGAVHKDKGDFEEGFGNLSVITKGKYKGGYTGFPQYGVAADVKDGDFLGMNVHEYHAVEPIVGEGNQISIRLSLVSYLREGVIKKCKGEPLLSGNKSPFKKAARILAKRKGKDTKKSKSKKSKSKKRTRKKRSRKNKSRKIKEFFKF